MSSQNIDVFLPVLIMGIIAVAIFVGALLVGELLSTRHPNKQKNTAYECGEEPTGTAWSQFNIRFYVVGLIFIIFDVESVLMFPIAAIFKQMNEMGNGGYILIVFLSFISVLLEGIAYCWKKGDLNWVMSYQKNKSEGSR
ncbi:MAG: NADH-quinone oxidoreductase subunit A [Bacteriovoracaceae bacterium]|nr:NADH-quinone oxidoreductase subunit A [Bacteriovoracaceae bacterium]